ncbi:hypothetical protein DPEC_G00085870 [Dallia pectoralis]|uniref:Uncharacterized protein n=1 Tax=Dallia pectoralis TaxID=75939 RepID=A0ACC2GZL4_DALPE|nr:hypothetical protein DPEC_G00085870 [Dallia pectoralis]
MSYPLDIWDTSLEFQLIREKNGAKKGHIGSELLCSIRRTTVASGLRRNPNSHCLLNVSEGTTLFTVLNRSKAHDASRRPPYLLLSITAWPMFVLTACPVPRKKSSIATTMLGWNRVCTCLSQAQKTQHSRGLRGRGLRDQDEKVFFTHLPLVSQVVASSWHKGR